MDNSKLNTLLVRGTDAIYPSKSFLEQKLTGSNVLKVYLGVDPTGELHVGHTVVLRKLRHFQDLGHKIVLLIGSFTAQIGDPTDKSQTRKQLTKDQVIDNAKNYISYAKCILDFDSENRPEIVYNGDWLEKLTFKDVVELAAHFSVQQMLERDMFQKRLQSNLPIGLHEFMYPLMQGYDSVALDVDVEIGGTDQTFNMLAGRKLLEQYRGKEKSVVAVPLLTDNNGKKMGKTEGNAVFLNLSPEDMYGSIMSLSDGFLENMFVLATDVSIEEIEQMMSDLSGGANPMKYKKKLAYILTKMFHGEGGAIKAQEVFEQVVQGNQLPADMPTQVLTSEPLMLRDLLVKTGLVASNGEAKRLIEEGAVSIFVGNEEIKKNDSKEEVEILDGMIVKVGKRRYKKIITGII
jgi:tyrosyl-tRNA synthetase